ncbi:hypothetical protein PR048_016316 [Dryococelus australis]|uniref:Uncharacterized protein n=1 Tax=Dryococelus australis TaxID=614101 RepID=A0ABQ9HJF5_9NEOP|nr:hypothetical protein PR048_016316 [Dryococelus australis]
MTCVYLHRQISLSYSPHEILEDPTSMVNICTFQLIQWFSPVTSPYQTANSPKDPTGGSSTVYTDRMSLPRERLLALSAGAPPNINFRSSCRVYTGRANQHFPAHAKFSTGHLPPPPALPKGMRCVVVRQLAFHLGESGSDYRLSRPGFSQSVGFLGYLPALLYTHFVSPSSALKTLDVKSRPNVFTHTLLLRQPKMAARRVFKCTKVAVECVQQAVPIRIAASPGRHGSQPALLCRLYALSLAKIPTLQRAILTTVRRVIYMLSRVRCKTKTKDAGLTRSGRQAFVAFATQKLSAPRRRYRDYLWYQGEVLRAGVNGRSTRWYSGCARSRVRCLLLAVRGRGSISNQLVCVVAETVRVIGSECQTAGTWVVVAPRANPVYASPSPPPASSSPFLLVIRAPFHHPSGGRQLFPAPTGNSASTRHLQPWARDSPAATAFHALLLLPPPPFNMFARLTVTVSAVLNLATARCAKLSLSATRLKLKRQEYKSEIRFKSGMLSQGALEVAQLSLSPAPEVNMNKNNEKTCVAMALKPALHDAYFRSSFHTHSLLEFLLPCRLQSHSLLEFLLPCRLQSHSLLEFLLPCRLPSHSLLEFLLPCRLQSSPLRRGLAPYITVFLPMELPETVIEHVIIFCYTHGAATDKMADAREATSRLVILFQAMSRCTGLSLLLWKLLDGLVTLARRNKGADVPQLPAALMIFPSSASSLIAFLPVKPVAVAYREGG